MSKAYVKVGVSGDIVLDRKIPDALIRGVCKDLSNGDKALYRRLLGLCRVSRKLGCKEIHFSA